MIAVLYSGDDGNVYACLWACVHVNKFNFRIIFTTPQEYGLVGFAFGATQYVFDELRQLKKTNSANFFPMPHILTHS